MSDVFLGYLKLCSFQCITFFKSCDIIINIVVRYACLSSCFLVKYNCIGSTKLCYCFGKREVRLDQLAFKSFVEPVLWIRPRSAKGPIKMVQSLSGSQSTCSLALVVGTIIDLKFWHKNALTYSDRLQYSLIYNSSEQINGLCFSTRKRCDILSRRMIFSSPFSNVMMWSLAKVSLPIDKYSVMIHST